MQAPGPAQIELIRRYARTLRQLQTESASARGPRAGARDQRLQRQAARFVQAMDGVRRPRAQGPRPTAV